MTYRYNAQIYFPEYFTQNPNCLGLNEIRNQKHMSPLGTISFVKGGYHVELLTDYNIPKILIEDSKVYKKIKKEIINPFINDALEDFKRAENSLEQLRVFIKNKQYSNILSYEKSDKFKIYDNYLLLTYLNKINKKDFKKYKSHGNIDLPTEDCYINFDKDKGYYIGQYYLSRKPGLEAVVQGVLDILKDRVQIASAASPRIGG